MTVSTEASCCSVVSSDDQLLLATAIDQLHSQQQQASTQQGSACQLSCCSLTDVHHQTCACPGFNSGDSEDSRQQLLYGQDAVSPDDSPKVQQANTRGCDTTAPGQQLTPQSSAVANSGACYDEHIAPIAAAAVAAAAAPDVACLTDLPAQQLQSCSRDASQVLLCGRGSLSDSEFAAITRDVAARIIQAHWHAYTQRQQRRWNEQEQQQDPQHQHAAQPDLSLCQRLQQDDGAAQPPGQQQEHTQQLHRNVSVPQQRAGSPSESSSSCCGPSDLLCHEPAAHAGQHQEQDSCTTALPTANGTAVAAVNGAVLSPTQGAGAAPPGSTAEQLGAQTSAAALGKLRVAAGSRNAAKLQHCKPAVQPTLPPAVSAHSTGATAWQPQQQADTSGSAGSSAGQQEERQLCAPVRDKLSTILAYLDAVEQEAPAASMQLRCGNSSRLGCVWQCMIGPLCRGGADSNIMLQ